MLTLVRIIMRAGALLIAVVVLVGLHGIMPQHSLWFAASAFFVMWMAFSFAVTLLAGSWMVGQPRAAGSVFGAAAAAAPEPQQKYQPAQRMCAAPDCTRMAAPGLDHCSACTLDYIKQRGGK